MSAKRAECVRTVANWSRIEKSHIFDQSSFDPAQLKSVMEMASPKLVALFKKIEELDAEDQKRDGVVYKHMIFTDVKQAQYGVKLLAAAFAAQGYTHLYSNKFEMKDEKELQKNKTFATLCSTTIYGKPMPVRFRKKVLELFNSRPDNIHGEQLRFILLDRGFKEGIDLFDIKYVHLFEPLISTTDEKQAVGRGTRFCGQKGLRFNPQKGWELHVFHYEVALPEELQEKYQSTRMADLYIKELGLDLRKLMFANSLEKVTMQGAVDYPLTRAIHRTTRENSSSSNSAIPGLQTLFDVKRPAPPSEERPDTVFDRAKINKRSKSVFDRFKMPLFDPKPMNLKLKKEGGRLGPKAPRMKMSSQKLHKYIEQRFKRYEWPPIRLENMCGEVKKDGGNSKPIIVDFTPTQNFVRNYFNPSSIYKGLLLYHGVGVGKTCSAMAIATTTFERQGYTILWVTRHTLKADIWKNMFQQVCSLVIKERIKKGEQIPEDAIRRPLKYLSKMWMPPISYKQFSNLLEGKNDLYHKMVARNGKEDPLRKTLVIIDEAHKLYAPDMQANERPNVKVLMDRIQHSYEHSKEDSCKVLLMTATPFNTDPMEMIHLLNLLRPAAEAMPADFDTFQNTYLDEETGKFTEEGRIKYMDDIAGYVSYLNREKDARQFAIPQYHNVIVNMTKSDRSKLLKQLRDTEKQLDELDADIAEGKAALVLAKQKMRTEKKQKLEDCKSAPRGTKKKCQDRVKEEMKEFEEELLGELNMKIEISKDEKKQLTSQKRALAKKAKDVKQDASQEGQLDARCYSKK